MNSFYDCLRAPNKHGHELEYFWVSGVCLVCVGLLGLSGNLSSLIVLCQTELRKKLFHKMLIALTIFDTLFIVSYGIGIGYESLACQPTNDNLKYFTRSFYNISFTGSIYMTIAVSVERYLRI